MSYLAIFLLLCPWGTMHSEARAQSEHPESEHSISSGSLDLQAVTDRALADVATWAKLDSFRIPVADVDRMAIEQVVRSNIQCRLQPEEIFPLPDSALRTLSSSLVGIYDIEARRVLVCMDNIYQLSSAIELPQLSTESAVYAIVVHELGHALADQRYSLRAFLTQAGKRGPDALMAAEAVMEGYSQHVARQVCTRFDQLGGFNTFTSAITALPPHLDAGERLFAQMLTEMVTFSYLDGEKFVQTVLATKQEGIEERIFRNPPTSRTEIGRPNWYLHPESRPSHGFDLENGVASLTRALQSEPEFEFNQRELAGAELSNANAILGQEKAAELGKLVVTCLANVGMRPDGEKMAILALSAFESETDADRFMALAHEASAAKDEALRQGGSIQVTASERTEVSTRNGKGSVFRKNVRYAGQDIPVTNALVQRGKLVLDLTLSNLEMDETAMWVMIRDSFSRAGATQGVQSDLKRDSKKTESEAKTKKTGG